MRRQSIDLEEAGDIIERRGRSTLRFGEVLRGETALQVEHTDSGLADMEYSAPAGMDLVGVGGHENLRNYTGPVSDMGEMDLEDHTEQPQQTEKAEKSESGGQHP